MNRQGPSQSHRGARPSAFCIVGFPIFIGAVLSCHGGCIVTKTQANRDDMAIFELQAPRQGLEKNNFEN
jgi:hypothetical protein